MKDRILALVITFVFCFALSSCGTHTNSNKEYVTDVTVISETKNEIIQEKTTETITNTYFETTTISHSEPTESPVEITTTATTTQTENNALSASFSLSNVPEYSGSPYVEINNNVPYFTEFPTDVFEIYSPLDDLGRCGVAYANICIEKTAAVCYNKG